MGAKHRCGDSFPFDLRSQASAGSVSSAVREDARSLGAVVPSSTASSARHGVKLRFFFSQHLCRSLSITARCIHPRSSGGGRNRRNCVSLHPTSTAAATATATTFSPEQLTANDRARPPHQIIVRIIYVKTSSLPRISLCAQHRSFLSSTSIPQNKTCLRRSHPPQSRHICGPSKLASADSASGLSMFFACEASHNGRLSTANPTSLEAGHLEWATPATFVGEAGHTCGR